MITSPRKGFLWLRETLRCSWANFITLVEWIICRNSDLWISVVWFAIISTFVGFWDWRLFMRSSSLVALFIDICLCYRASGYFCRLNLDLRMITLIILSKHSTCFCAELICRAYHSIEALLKYTIILLWEHIISSLITVRTVRSLW